MTKRRQYYAMLIALPVVAFAIWYSFTDFRTSLYEAQMQKIIGEVSDLAVQGAALVEAKLTGDINILRNTAEILSRTDEDWEEVKGYLLSVAEDSENGIARIGIIDAEGTGRAVDGLEFSAEGRDYYLEAMQGNVYINGTILTDLTQERCIVISVPVYEGDEVTRVLYGAVQLQNLNIYADTGWDVEDSRYYIHIVDDEGDYILRTENQQVIIEGDNLYEGIEALESEATVSRIREAIAGGEAIDTYVSRDGEGRYVFFAPTNIRNWSVVTVILEEQIERAVDYIYDMTNVFICRIVFAVLSVAVLGFILLKREWREVRLLNQELRVKDTLFAMILADSKKFVFRYNTGTQGMEFLNYDAGKLALPERFEFTPVKIKEYIKDCKENDAAMNSLFAALAEGKTEVEAEFLVDKEEGLQNYLLKFVDEDGAAKGERIVFGFLENITDRRDKETRIRHGQQMQAALTSGSIGYFEANLSRDTVILDEEAGENLLTYDGLIEDYAHKLVVEKDRTRVEEFYAAKSLLERYEAGERSVSLEYLRRDLGEEPLWVCCEVHLKKDEASGDILAVGVTRNIDRRRREEIRLEQQAFSDPLTGALNRVGAERKINGLLCNAAADAHAFLLLDLDHFKEINDTLGHQVGDSVLIDVAELIQQQVRKEDIVCRLGGDEFVVFLTKIPKMNLERIASGLLEKLRLNYGEGDQTVSISASIGIALSREGDGFHELYKRADLALYEVKRSGKDSYRIHEEQADAQEEGKV